MALLHYGSTTQAVRARLPAVGRAAGWAAGGAARLEAREAPWGVVGADTDGAPPAPPEELFDLVVCTDPTQLPGYAAPPAQGCATDRNQALQGRPSPTATEAPAGVGEGSLIP